MLRVKFGLKVVLVVLNLGWVSGVWEPPLRCWAQPTFFFVKLKRRENMFKKIVLLTGIIFLVSGVVFLFIAVQQDNLKITLSFCGKAITAFFPGFCFLLGGFLIRNSN